VAVALHLHADLAELVRRGSARALALDLDEPAAVKDRLESLGIPHTEVDLLLVDGRPADLAHRLRGSELVEAYPVPPAAAEAGRGPLAPHAARRLQPRPLARTRFLCDQHLGKLARLLRMLGLDTAYDRNAREPELARRAVVEDRAVLTCHRGLLMRREILCGRLIRSRRPDDQVAEVIRRFVLVERLRPFGRCSACNGLLAAADRDEVAALVPARTRAWLDRYFRCTDCGRIYWEGTHVSRLRNRFATIIEAARDT
jgi:uncharacterized protein with PIN domain